MNFAICSTMTTNLPISVFFSYAHEDELLRDELAKHLKLLVRQGVIKTWYDRDITAGSEWAGQIDQNMEAAQVILLLVSADFLASDYCYDKELIRSIERHDAGEARVIPVILREVDWQGAPFAKLQALPKNSEPVTSWANRDQAFADIARGIRRTVEDLQPDSEPQSSGTGSMSLNQVSVLSSIAENLPRSGAVQFVGRQETIQQLHQLCYHQNSAKVTAVIGMGGVGKTELALQYALSYRNDYTAGICWLQARSGDIGSQIIQFCRLRLNLSPSEELDLLTQVEFCWTHWTSGNALIILDDVTDYKAIKPFLPPNNPRFKVLITTRLRLGKSVQQLELNVFSEASAIALLESLVTPERVQAELNNARKLLAWLGYLPLGVELVGRYLERKPDFSLEEMQERLQTKSLNERSLKKSDDDMTARTGVAAAFELSWETLPEAARHLSCLLSLFAIAPIPWKLVERCCSEADPEDLEELRDEMLLNLHLLQRKGSGLYQLHQLVREFLRNKLELIEESDELSRQFCQAMVDTAQQVPESPTRKLILQMSSAMPHIAETATQLSHTLNESAFTQPFQALARFYEGQGFYEKAETWAEIFHQKAKEQFGSEHPLIATSLDNLAFIYKSRGKYAEAEPLYLQALEMRKKLLSNEHPEVADSLNNLALLYDAQGRYTEAESLCIQALEMRKKLLKDQHPDIADSLNNLGLLYVNQGKCLEAEPLLEEALTLRKQLLGSEHPRIATSLNNLAYCYSNQEKYKEAEPLYIKALELYKCLLGEDHPEVAISLNNLAYHYVNQSRYAEAEPLFIQALEILKQAFGNEHPNIATGLNNLAYVYDIQDRFAEAEPLCRQALDMRKRLLGENHVDVGISLNNLATLCRLQKRYEEAENLYLQSIEILKLQLGEDHPLTMQVTSNLDKLQDAKKNEFDITQA